MASNITVNSSSYDGRYLQLVCTQEKNIAGNYSTINWILSAVGGSQNYYSTGATTVTINGQQVYYQGRVSYKAKSFPAAKGSVSGSTTVYHNTQGDANISISLTTAIYSEDLQTKSASWTLDTIPRAATLLTAPDFTDDENPTITYSNPSGSNIYSIEACISFNWSNDDIPYRALEKNGSSYTFNLDNYRKLLRENTNSGSNTRQVIFFIKTIVAAGAAPMYSTLVRTLTIADAEPTLSATVYENNDNVSALTGSTFALLKGNNEINYYLSAAAAKEATITEYSLINGGNTYTTQSGTIYNTIDNVFIAKIKDSRGNIKEQTVTLQPVIDYVPLTASLEAEMELVGETTAKISIDIRGDYFNNSFGAVRNSLTVYFRCTEGDSSYTDTDWLEAGFSVSDNSYSSSVVVNDLDYTKNYTIQAKVVDKVKAVYSSTAFMSINPVFDWSDEDFNFNVPLIIQGNNLDDFAVSGGSNAMGSNGTWHYKLYKNGYAVCWGTRNYGNMGVSNAWGALYKSADFTQALPSNLFMEAPEFIDIQPVRSTSGLAVYRGYGNTLSATSTDTFCLVAPVAVTAQQVHLSFYVVGRWK